MKILTFFICIVLPALLYANERPGKRKSFNEVTASLLHLKISDIKVWENAIGSYIPENISWNDFKEFIEQNNINNRNNVYLGILAAQLNIPKTFKEYFDMVSFFTDHAKIIINTADYLMSFNPTVEQVISLTRTFGNIPEDTMHILLKHKMLDYHLIDTPREFIALFEYGNAAEYRPLQSYRENVSSLIEYKFDYFLNLRPSIQEIIDLFNSGYILRDGFKTEIIPFIKEALQINDLKRELEFMAAFQIIDLNELNKYNDKEWQDLNLSCIIDLFPDDFSLKFLYYTKNQQNISGVDFYNLIKHDPFKVSQDYKNEVNNLIFVSLLYFIKSKSLKTIDFDYLLKAVKEFSTSGPVQLSVVKNLQQLKDKYNTKQKSKIVRSLLTEIQGQLPNSPVKKKVKKKFSCPVCLTDLENATIVECSNSRCNGTSCEDCFNDSMNIQNKEKCYPLKCDWCKGEISLNEYNDDQIFYYHKKINPESKNCATPDCSNRINKMEGHYKCTFCGYSYCFNCEHNHFGKTCLQFKKDNLNEEEFYKLIHDPASEIRPCPWCLTPTEKKEACDHMNCLKCNKDWDWKYGKRENTPIHYSKRDGTEPREYRVEGD